MLITEGLAYQYPEGEVISFPDVNLAKGQHCALLGKSGCGKSTLLHLLGGLLQSQLGAITIGTTAISQLKGAKLDQFRGQHIGFVFQKPHLVKALTVSENVALAQSLAGLKVDQSAINSILSELSIAELAHKRPGQISQGQAQRVAIARALVNAPDIILADEPTASLDDENAGKVMDLLVAQANRHNANLLVATHDQRVKAIIDHHYTLGEG